MIDELTICRLQPGNASQMAELRKEALVAAPLAFGSSPDDDRFISVGAVERALGEGGGTLRAILG